MATQLATTSLSNWEYHNFHVQSALKGGEFISAESTLIASGPPELSDVSGSLGGDFAYPIGVLENVGLSQSKQLQRIFEIGSTRSYFIPGRVVGSVSIGRVIYYGPSLLKSLYAYFPFSDANVMGEQVSDKDLIASPNRNFPKLYVQPGYGDLMLNLGSDMFNHPTGMAMYLRGQTGLDTAAIYLEDCYVQGHQMSISSGSVLVMEGASLQYDRLVPINLSITSHA